MTYKRINQGFTMMEVMIVVAILAIMAALVFVNLVPFMKSLYQKEMDETARELYVAAQNHLTIADSMGFLEGKSDKGATVSITVGEGSSAETKTAYYYAVGADKSVLDSATHPRSILPYMLPFGSIDDTVRLGGTYVIIYDPDTASVLQVFYGNPSGRYGNSTYFSTCPALDTYAGDENKENRQNYGDNGTIIGWYGGASDGVAPEELTTPNVTIENIERLYVKAWWRANAVDTTNLEVGIIITGKTSGKSTPLFKLARQASVTDDDKSAGIAGGSVVYGGCLDDITGNYDKSTDTSQANILGSTGHFAERFSQFGLIPGEDVTISTFAYYTSTVGDKLYKVAKGSRVTTNSLFRSVGREVDPNNSNNTYSAARISNIRHLENLSEAISGYDRDKLTAAAVTSGNSNSTTGAMTTASALSETSRRTTVTTPAPGGMTPNATTSIDPSPTHAHQIADLSWAAFQTKVGGPGKSVTTVANATTPAVQTIAGKYMPVETTYSLSYYGGNHKVVGVDVDTTKNGEKATSLSEGAGMFGTLASVDLHNIELVDFKVKAANGNAGALAGTLSGTSTVKNVLVHNNGKDGADSGLEITGTGSVGGLVGSAEGCTIEKSAASVYVKTTGANAGGLIGVADSTTKVTGCYAGGHTVNGDYNMETTTGPGRVNVVATTNAGGLIGSSAAAVSACYATNSVSGATAGGLVGTATDGSVAHSYAAGKVGGTTAAGALISSSSTTTTIGNGNKFSEAVTGSSMLPIAGDETNSAKVTDLFPTLDAYRAYVGRDRAAKPYDSTLTSAYTINNKCLYPMPAIADLQGQASGSTYTPSDNDPDLVTTHYGDWPKPETEVVNK